MTLQLKCCNHVSDCNVQCIIGTRNYEMTVCGVWPVVGCGKVLGMVCIGFCGSFYLVGPSC